MKTILMIDDDSALVRIVEDILAPSGYSFHSAGTGADGLRRAESLRPDLVILDVNLPDMLGFEVCRSLRQNIVTKGIPVLMLTGHYFQASDKVKALDLGADDYLVKPFDSDILAVRVDAILRRSGLEPPPNVRGAGDPASRPPDVT